MSRQPKKSRRTRSARQRRSDRVLRFDQLENRSMLAAHFVVNTTLDTVDITPGDGIAADAQGNTSLRAAIMEANALSGNDTITLPAGTYTLTRSGAADDTAVNGDLDITDGLTIFGAGSGETIIDAAGDRGLGERIFDMPKKAALSIEFHGMTLTGGRAIGSTYSEQIGGAMRIEFYNNVLITDTHFLDNQAPVNEGSSYYGLGGAISSTGKLEIRESRFEGNYASNSGGAIYSAGNLTGVADGVTLEVFDTTFTGNDARFGGGALSVAVPTTIHGSTFDHNTSKRAIGSSGQGGAIEAQDGPYSKMSITNSTFSANEAVFGGAIINNLSRSATQDKFSITSSTFVKNTGTAIYTNGSGAAITFANTIVANNSGPARGRDVVGAALSLGYNLVGDVTGASGFIGTGDLTGTAENPLDPRLGPLGDHGGPTFTHALLIDSLAIDSGNTSLAPATDQRGVARPQGLAVDIGAFEREDVAPIAVDDSAATQTNQTVVIPVLANDSDQDGDQLQVESVTQGTHGTVTINADGTVTYLPDPDYEGQDSFTYTVNDGTGFTDVATVTIQIGLVRTPPVAQDDSYTLKEDTPLTVSAVASGSLDQVNDREDGMHVFNAKYLNLQQQVVAGQAGQLSSVDLFVGQNTEAGAVLDFFVTRGAPWRTGVKSFQTQYIIQESDINNWITINVSAGNFELSAGETFTIGTVANSSATLFFYATNSDLLNGDNYAAGSLYVDGNIRLTPAQNDYDLRFRTHIGSGSTADPLLANDYDPDGDPLTASLTTQAAHGTVVLEADGSFTYTPNSNFQGEDSFTYTISDGQGGFDTATVSLTVTGANDAPEAVNDIAATNEDTSVVIDILANDSDLDGDTLQVTFVTNPRNGTAILNADQTVTYTPAENYFGSDIFYYDVSDGNGITRSASVTVNVAAVNDPPVLTDDVLEVDEDQKILNYNILDNDWDVDGPLLKVVDSTIPQHGTLISQEDGQISYIPNKDYFGSDSFTYTVEDGAGGSSTATVTITVKPVDDAPIAVNDSATTDEDTPVTINLLANDIELDGDPLSIDQISTPPHGTVIDNGNGTITFTPQKDFNGTERIAYRVSDGNGVSEWATIEITITPVNDPPSPVVDIVWTDEDTPITIAVLDNDQDIDGDTLSVISVGEAPNGTTQVNADGTITYTPNANYNGNDTFSYTVSDGNGATATSSITVTVTPTNDPPVAVDDTFEFLEDHGYLLHLVDNDIDIDGDELIVLNVSSPVHGRTEERSAGWIYLPDLNFYGTETLTYEVSDGHGGTNTATIVIHVAPVNDPPSPVDDEASTDEDTAVEIDVLLNDSDVEDDPLSITAVSTPTHGTVEVTSTEKILYTPVADFHGSDSFTYTIDDGSGKTRTATVVVTVGPTNDAPVAVNDSAETKQNTPVIIHVLANDSDIDGDTLTVSATSEPGQGSVQINADGTITYTPDALVTGNDSFTYTISDGNGEEATATVEVFVAENTSSSLVTVTLVRNGLLPSLNEVDNTATPFFHEWQKIAGHVWLDVEEVASEPPVDVVIHLTSSTTYFIDPEISSHLGTSATLENSTDGDARSTTLTLSGVDLSTYQVGDRVLLGTLLFQPDSTDRRGLSADLPGEYASLTTDVGFALDAATIVNGKILNIEPEIAANLGPVIYDHTEDGLVGLADFADFVIAFGKKANAANPDAYRFDYDRDGRVSLSDFALFVQCFGTKKSANRDILMPGLSEPLPSATTSTLSLEAEPLSLNKPLEQTPYQPINVGLAEVNHFAAAPGLTSVVFTPAPERSVFNDVSRSRDLAVETLAAVDFPIEGFGPGDRFDPRLIDAILNEDNFLDQSANHSSQEEPWEETLAAISDRQPNTSSYEE
ncbi:Ig-like domain-containing protein [Bremerella cremea]|nr:Ig-like domain-containing protein [Bremerella cremea]